VFTVNESIANIYHSQYGNKVGVVRNLPFKKSIPAITRKELGLPADKKIILLQGAGINKDRGAEELVESIYFMHSDKVIFLIIGSGDVIPELEDKIWRHGLSEKVFLKGKMPMEELIKYTSVADLGVSMDKDTNLNYRYSLPNKLFDYIQCGVPVFASNLVEVKKIIDDYKVGFIASNHEPSYLGNKLLEIFADEEALNSCKENARKAAEELCWENEKYKFEQIIQHAFQS
jgi:glycosyltransferase involved in cell wall biosynthesis